MNLIWLAWNHSDGLGDLQSFYLSAEYNRLISSIGQFLLVQTPRPAPSRLMFFFLHFCIHHEEHQSSLVSTSEKIVLRWKKLLSPATIVCNLLWKQKKKCLACTTSRYIRFCLSGSSFYFWCMSVFLFVSFHCYLFLWCKEEDIMALRQNNSFKQCHVHPIFL